ncbi:unnamed protein product [Diatraea saccharalis]|uniref:HAT C-terminal dimerisation domain-containing protein n=1 Tax=Diatraea saccharalis TaxID=40085 RepID=A0A9N9R564_9NEOP|nr:unnamed protein product [Diatraea saccharalis]
MLKKSFKIRARTGGIRRKISKEHARIMSSNSTNTRQKDLGEVSCDNKKEGSVGQVGSENKQDTTFSCLQKNIVNENTQQNRVHSSPLYFSENDRPQSSEESEDDSDIDKYVKCSSFRENIRRWAIEKNINQTALKDLAKIMNGLIPKILPMDPRTIVKTPRFANIKKIEGGEYWHNGITHNLILLLENWTDVPDSISLNLNFDGLPIFKSSKKEFWPILCNISENTNIKPLVIGIYYGIGKPKNLTTYLEDFIAEVNHLLDEGITLSQNCEKKITIKIRCFVCDSPARAFIKGVCNFHGKHGCMKCVTVGEYSHNSHTVTFPDTICSERTNDGFRNKLYGAHHKNDSPLLNLPIDLVKDFPVGDSLHLIDLGIMKRLLVAWRDGSTERTKILQTFLTEPENVTVKILSHTRWSARDDACSSLNKNWEQIIKALEAIKSNSSQQKALIKNEATGLLAQLNSLETAILSEFWGSVLKQFNTVSKVLQGVDTNVEVVSNLYDSLITFVKNQRELFDAFEKAGKEKCTEDYKDSRKRITKRKKRDDEQREGEVILQGRDYFKVNTFLPICDQLLGELRRRKTSYDAVTAKFVFLSNLSTLSEAEIKLNALSLQKSYPTDLADDLKDECILLKNFLPSQGQETKTSLRELNLLINKKDLKVAFPYIEIALRIFLCTAVTNCSAERSFSVLKRIKNYLRSRLIEERLNNLAILNHRSRFNK